jgi:hypothetical protein
MSAVKPLLTECQAPVPCEDLHMQCLAMDSRSKGVRPCRLSVAVVAVYRKSESYWVSLLYFPSFQTLMS